MIQSNTRQAPNAKWKKKTTTKKTKTKQNKKKNKKKQNKKKNRQAQLATVSQIGGIFCYSV